MNQTTKGILALLIEGNTPRDIREALAEKGIKDPDAAISAAVAELERQVAIPAGARRAWCLEATREVYRRLLATGDYAGAGKAIQDYAKLAGLTARPAATQERTKAAPSANSPQSTGWELSLPELPAQ